MPHIAHTGLDRVVEVPPSTAKVLARRGWEPTDPTKVPDGTVDDVTAWVGDDPVRATTARAAETKRPEPRVTLLDSLDRVRRAQLDDTAPEADPTNLPDSGDANNVPLEED